MLTLLHSILLAWWSGLFALIAYAITHILMNEGMILWGYTKLIMRLPNWLYKPLGGCDVCFAGQIGFWGYIVIFMAYGIEAHLSLKTLLYALISSLLTILATKVITEIKKSITDGN